MQTDFTDPNQLSAADDLDLIFKEEVVEQAEEQVQEQAEEAKQIAFNEELVSTLEKYPHIHSVWINESGEWHFAEKPGYNAFAREEILNG